MAVLQIENLTKYFGEYLLFDNFSLIINEGEKVALVAKNGTGKTSLLNIILGKDVPESGIIFIHPECRVGYLEQNPELNSDLSIFNEVYYSYTEIIETITNYNKVINSKEDDDIQSLNDKMDALQAWDYETRVNFILSKIGFQNTDQIINTLSGGQKKRVALAKILLQSPDFIILDEPTNHLDMDIIEWLETFLSSMKSTLFMVTHDRYFLDRVCNTIIEIDNKTAYKYNGNYSYFIEKKEERMLQLSVELSKANNLFKNELEWMNRQPQARATKAKARIQSFYDLEEKVSKKIDNDSFDISIKGKRLGNKVVELFKLSKAYGPKVLLKDFTYAFIKNEKVGIIGPNGSGKTSLLHIISEQMLPDSGRVEYGETVRIGYYKQDGLLVKEDCKVIDVIKEKSEQIVLEEGKSISASAFLEQWLFPREMHYMYVSKLSGGEKKRLYLMTILMQQPNFLILDEPTNDLDLYTLHLLEEYLSKFAGCVLIVSHDRFFTDKVVDHLFVFKGDGVIQDFPGNYSQYQYYCSQKTIEERKVQANIEKPIVTKEFVKKGLTFKEKKEIEQLEKELDSLNKEKAKIEDELQAGLLSNSDLVTKSQRIGDIMALIDEKEFRWLELQEF